MYTWRMYRKVAKKVQYVGCKCGLTMASGKKRSFDEVEVSEMVVSPSAVVHGVFVGDVSPVKESRTKNGVKLFEGRFTDGKKVVRMVSFEPKLKFEVDKAKESGEGVAIINCAVKASKANSEEMEIVCGSKTKLVSSPKKFKVDTSMAGGVQLFRGARDVVLEEVAAIAVNERVNVKGKVVSVDEVATISAKSREKDLTKQDFVFADATGVCRGVIWEDRVGLLEVEKSYELKNVTVRAYQGVKYLSLSEKAEVKEVCDVGDVSDEVIDSESVGVVVVKGEIVSVCRLDEYMSCRVCNAKLVELNKVFGQCTKCGTKAKLSKVGRNTAANVMIEDDAGKEHRVTMFDEVVQQVMKDVQEGDDVAEKLLGAPVMKYTISKKGIVSSVQ